MGTAGQRLIAADFPDFIGDENQQLIAAVGTEKIIDYLKTEYIETEHGITAVFHALGVLFNNIGYRFLKGGIGKKPCQAIIFIHILEHFSDTPFRI